MGFETLKFNSVAAQMSRGKSENSRFCYERCWLWQFSMDVCLYMSQILISYHFAFASYNRFRHAHKKTGCF
jgi:hypothetical protein